MVETRGGALNACIDPRNACSPVALVGRSAGAHYSKPAALMLPCTEYVSEYIITSTPRMQVFLGGAVLADIMKEQPQFWISREEWEEDPRRALAKCGSV